MRLRAGEHALVDGELDSLRGGPRAEVVHARLEAFLPAVEVHARQLAECRRLEMHVERLALADERAAVRREVEHFLLADLPDGFVDRLDVIRDRWDVLHGAIVRNDHVLHVVVP